MKEAYLASLKDLADTVVDAHNASVNATAEEAKAIFASVESANRKAVDALTAWLSEKE